MWYHVVNRDNHRDADLHKPADHDAFVKSMAGAADPWPVDPLGYGLMPNDFHLLIRTHTGGDLGRWVG
jgi:hypothetical protein